MIHTDNEKNVEAVVEWRTDNHSCDAEGQEAIAESGRNRGEKSYRVTGH